MYIKTSLQEKLWCGLQTASQVSLACRISENTKFVSKQFFSLQSLVDSENSIREGAGEGLSPRVCNTVSTSQVHTLSARAKASHEWWKHFFAKERSIWQGDADFPSSSRVVGRLQEAPSTELCLHVTQPFSFDSLCLGWMPPFSHFWNENKIYKIALICAN